MWLVYWVGPTYPMIYFWPTAANWFLIFWAMTTQVHTLGSPGMSINSVMLLPDRRRSLGNLTCGLIIIFRRNTRLSFCLCWIHVFIILFSAFDLHFQYVAGSISFWIHQLHICCFSCEFMPPLLYVIVLWQLWGLSVGVSTDWNSERLIQFNSNTNII